MLGPPLLVPSSHQSNSLFSLAPEYTCTRTRAAKEVIASKTNDGNLDQVWLIIGGLGSSKFCFRHGEQKQQRDGKSSRVFKKS